MSSSYIIAACRSPIGRMGGGLARVAAPKLGGVCIAECLRRAGAAAGAVDEVIMGNVLSAGIGQAPARQAALQGGCSPNVAALTINKMCGSGLKAVMLADQAIRAGDASLIVAGGMENMSQAPHLLPGVRGGWKFGHQTSLDSMLHDGLWCAIENRGMGAIADQLAVEKGISRQEQDQYAARSHARAMAAGELFQAEIVDVTTSRAVFQHDEGPRATTLEDLAGLRPAFATDGTVTAGNASQISDGAAAVAVASEKEADRWSGQFRARIVATAVSGGLAKDLFLAPIDAVRQVLAKSEWGAAEVDCFELNEAFAVQTLACLQELDIPEEKTNVRGGAIALGHPIGASGARVLVTLLYALQSRGGRRGVAALCLGGGNAVAMAVEVA